MAALVLDTYSFSDVNVVIQPPGFPAYSINGNGIGEINISYADDNTIHDRSADGRVMVSKINANNGSFSITTQQVSPLNIYLRNLFKTLKNADSTKWASTTVTVDTIHGAVENIVLTGVSFSKRADLPYQAQGQMVTWNFMAVDIYYLT